MQTQWQKFDQKWDLQPLPPANKPIFLLGAVWRSGTTLAQRLICSTNEVLLWGEPYGDAGFITGMARSASGLLRPDWLAEGHFPQRSKNDLTEKVFARPQDYWIANLYPEPHAIRQSFRNMLDAMLQQPAKDRDKQRFGLKEIRLDGLGAQFLHWIYPDARFVILVRNPWNAWKSYKGAGWFFSWPDVKVTTASVFCKIWLRNMKTFLALKSNPAYKFIRFEDIFDGGKTLTKLEEHCHLAPIERSVLSVRIRGMRKPPSQPTSAEFETIKRICGPLAQKLGYGGLDSVSPSSFLDDAQ